MRLDLLEKVRGLFARHPAVAMKEARFEGHFDDIGQWEGDPERRTAPPEPPRPLPPQLPDDEIDEHVEKDPTVR